MNMLKRIACWLCLAGAWILGGANLVTNSDFSQLNDKKFPASWSIISLGGAQSARIAGPEGKVIPVMMFDLQNLDKVTRIEHAVTLTPGRQYKVSFYSKCENLSGAAVYLVTMQWSGGNSQQLKGSSGWKKYEFTTSFSGSDSIYRLILYAGKNTTGKVYFTDVQVEEVLSGNASVSEAFITVPRFAQAPVIDGRLDDAVYKNIPQYTPFVEVGNYQYSRFARDNTVLYMGYDDKNLYAAFKCYQECLDPVRNQLDLFKNSISVRDGAVVKDDCVRLFISKGGDSDPVYEFTVNSLGTLKDAKCTGQDIWSGRDLSYNSSASCAGSVGNGFYIVEMAVPLKETLAALQPGDKIKIMAGRLNQSRQSSTIYFPRAQAFHLRSVLGNAVIGNEVPEVANWNMHLNQAAGRKLTFDSNSTGIVTLNAAGENNKLLQRDFKFNAGNNSFAYALPGQEYNSVAFTLKADGRVFWQTPQYIIGNALVNTTVWSNGKVQLFSAEQGIYPAPPAVEKMQKNGFDGVFDLDSPPEYLAVNQTLFWPEDNNNFHIAAGSLQSLHITATTSERKLENLDYQLHIFLPEDFTIEAASAVKKIYQLTVEPLAEKRIGKHNYRHYVVKSSSPQLFKIQPDNYDIYTLLIRCTENARADLPAYVFASYDNGRIVEVPQTLKLNLYPELNGPQPKLFRSEMWGGAMVNLADREANLRFLIDTVRASGFNQLQNFPVPGMKRMGVAALERLVYPRTKKLLPSHPEFRKIDRRGQAVPENNGYFLCTEALAYDPIIAAIAREEVAKQLKDYDVLCFDYESPALDGALSCYCDRCLGKFAEFAGLETAPQRQEIAARYRLQWRDFMTGRLAECCKMLQQAVHANNKEFYFYSGYQSEKTLNYYTVDWNKLAEHLDLAGAGYTRTRKEIEATTRALNGVPLMAGVIVEPWHVYLRQKSLQISMAYLAAGLTGGSKGFLVYNLPGCDGRSFYNFSRFTKFLSEYEEILYYGKRSESDFKLQGLSPECGTVFTLNGKKRIAICYNSSNKNAQVRITLPFGKGKEYFSNKKFSGRSFTFELAAGEMAAFIEE